MQPTLILQQSDRACSLPIDENMENFRLMKKPNSVYEFSGFFETHFPERRPDSENPLFLGRKKSHSENNLLDLQQIIDTSIEPQQQQQLQNRNKLQIVERLQNEKLEEILNCVVCTKLSTSSELLKCLHTICTDCLLRSTGDTSNPYQCPKCLVFSERTDIIGNTLAENLAELLYYANGQLKCLDCSCKIVEELEKCSCKQYRCRHCQNKHSKQTKHQSVAVTLFIADKDGNGDDDDDNGENSSVFQDDDVKKLDQPTKMRRSLPAIDFDQLRLLQSLQCHLHKKPIECFCARCDELICNDCRLPNHIRHPIHVLKVASKPFEIKMETLKGQVESAFQPYKNINLIIDDYERSLQENVISLKRKIEERCQNLHKQLDVERQELLEELQKIEQQEVVKISARKRNLRDSHTTFQTAINYVDVALKYSLPSEILTVRQKVSNRLLQLTKIDPPPSLAKQSIYLQNNMKADNDHKLIGSLHSYPVWPSVALARNLNTGKMPNSPCPELRGHVKIIMELNCYCEQIDQEKPNIVAVCVLDDNSGYLFVDEANKCIKLMSKDGQVKQSIGRRTTTGGAVNNSQSTSGKLNSPRDVAILPQGHIVVADRTRLVIFSRMGEHIMDIDKFVDVVAVTINQQGQILALDAHSKTINVYSPINGCFLYTIDNNNNNNKLKNGVDNNHLKADNSIDDVESPSKLGQMLGFSCSPSIVRKNLLTNPSASDNGSNNGSGSVSNNTNNGTNNLRQPQQRLSNYLENPQLMTISNMNEILITDTIAPHLKIFTMNGIYKKASEQLPHLIGVLKQPHGICCDSNGFILIADQITHRVHVYKPDGKFLRYLLTKNDALESPTALATDLNGNLLVAQRNGLIKLVTYC